MESSDEEKEKAKTTTTSAPPPKKKKSVAQKVIADAVKREQMNNNDGNEAEDEIERKKRENQAIKDADLENTKGMFQGVSIKETEVDEISSNNKEISQSKTIKDSPLDRINPKSKEEFDEFSKLLVERIRKHEKQNMYVNFINEFIRELCLPLKDADVRKVANTLSTLANEKQKQIREKEKPKKKGKAKPSLQVENYDAAVDITDYGTYDDFEDDFM
jgi:translation initiation factor 3 subunit J